MQLSSCPQPPLLGWMLKVLIRVADSEVERRIRREFGISVCEISMLPIHILKTTMMYAQYEVMSVTDEPE